MRVACGAAATEAGGGTVSLTLPLEEIHPWEAGAGRLYDFGAHLREDRVKSYFGLREVKLDGYRFLINGKSVFQRLVLDQAFIRTASTQRPRRRRAGT